MLRFPDTPGLRPTPDRVRQTVFNWLGQDLTGWHCLDLFSGTGAMGFEALSRGAHAVIMVERSKSAYEALLNNQQLLQARQAQILQQDALQFLGNNVQKFNLIFIDPPYQQQWLPKVLPLLPMWLQQEALIYVEAEFMLQSGVEWMRGWQIVKQGKAGNVFYHLLKLDNDSNGTTR